MKFTGIILFTLFIVSCGSTQKKLPILGEPNYSGKDSSYPIIANFSVTDQDGNIINNQSFDNKIYVADFIFLSCPSICPTMTATMKKIYLTYAAESRINFISYSIDPKHDTIPRLKAYARKLGVRSDKWHFVTGNQDSIFQLSEHSYFSTAYPDSVSPGGFTHSGGLLLVDKNRHLRGVYNAANPEETIRLKDDIQILLKEQF
jgi:protein SCO1/2